MCYSKSVFIISIGVVTYALIGFNTHYPLGDWGIVENWLSIGGPFNRKMEISEGRTSPTVLESACT